MNQIRALLQRTWEENRGLVLFIALMLVFRSALADWNHVPSASMLPTIVEGDRILVNKLAYDLRVPFTQISLYRFADPTRGDIVVFDSLAAGKRMVKRVVGLPGDVVEMRHNALIINGQPLRYVPLGRRDGAFDQRETLAGPGTEHAIRVAPSGSALDTFVTRPIPAGFYLVLGDNRDNSADSRVFGLVPRDEIVGRSRHVVLSFDRDNWYLPRPDRYLQPL